MDPNEKTVKEIVSKIIKVPPDQIGNEEDLIETHGMDSLARIEIMTELEKVFDVMIDDSMAQQLRTVGQCLELVKTLASKK